MALKTTPFDAAEYLDSPAACAAYLESAMDDGDAATIADALGVVARARGMTQIARETGLSRESLYRALRADGNPEFATLLRVVRALGLRFSVSVAEPAET